MSSKVIFVIGVAALILWAAFLFMRTGTSRPGTAAVEDAGKVQEELTAVGKEHEELKARLAGLREQLAAKRQEKAAITEKAPAGRGEKMQEAAPLSPAQQLRKSLDLEKFVKFLARMVKAEKEGKEEEVMGGPEGLEMQADLMKLMANMQRELGLSMMDPSLERAVMSLMLESLCKELGADFSPEQSSRIEAMSSKLVGELLRVKGDETMFEVERVYARGAAVSVFNKEFKGFLTGDQKEKLGRIAEEFENPRLSWRPTRYDQPKNAGEQAQAWQGAFGIDRDSHTGELTTIAQEYLASREELETRYGTVERERAEEFIRHRETIEEMLESGKTQALTDQQREEKEREMVQIEVETLKKIAQLELTEQQRGKVRNYNPFSVGARMYRRSPPPPERIERVEPQEPTVIVLDDEIAAISKLRTLSSAQELYNAWNNRYATTFEELQEKDLIDKSFQDDNYTYELTSTAPDKWYGTATPANWARKHLYIDETGVLRAQVDRPADENSPPLK